MLLTLFFPALILAIIGSVIAFSNTNLSKKTRFVTFLILIIIYTAINWYLLSWAKNHGLKYDNVSYAFTCIFSWFINIIIIAMIELVVMIRK